MVGYSFTSALTQNINLRKIILDHNNS